MASQSNVIKDMSTLTKISNRILNELVYKEELCIGNAIHEAMLDEEDVAILDIGIGTLSVDLSTKKCKFIPSKELSNIIKKSLDNKIDPLEFELEQSIIDKLLTICDEAF